MIGKLLGFVLWAGMIVWLLAILGCLAIVWLLGGR